jgi:beta-lactamase class A
VQRIADRLPAGALSVAVRDERTGTQFVFGARGGMWTGSVYKLLVLETLLMQRQAAGSWLSSAEVADATAMIERSDNDAGYRLFLDAGGTGALAATAHELGMRQTVVATTDPALTTMSARDGLALLGGLLRGGVLDQRSRAFALNLMRGVQADQRWGVGVLADAGDQFANKNGWMAVDSNNGPGENDGGLWLANSLGIVRVDGRPLLVSIFTRHNPDLDTGVRLVERLARAAAPAVLPSR